MWIYVLYWWNISWYHTCKIFPIWIDNDEVDGWMDEFDEYKEDKGGNIQLLSAKLL